jgi:colanic acid/amylovoran biosynthesis protein
MRPVRIGLLWHSLRSGNLGVGALTVSNMTLLAQAARGAGREPHVTILGAKDRYDRYPLPFDYPVKECFFRQKSLLPGSAFRRKLHECDIVFDIGAGDSFSDLYGLQRYCFLLFTKLAVRDPSRRLVLSPQTIGPFNSAFARLTAPHAFARSRDVWARDALSFERLSRIAPRARGHLTTDVAFSMPFERPAGREGKPVVGLNISALLFRESAAGRTNRFALRENYSQLIVALLKQLAARSDVSCCLIPHVIAPDNLGEDDHALASELAAQYGVAVSERFASPIAAKSFIAGLDLLIGSRMHATIAGLSAGVPVLPLGYSEKFSRLFSDLGYPVSVDLRQATIAGVVAQLDDLLARLSDYRGLAQAAAATAQQRLDPYRAYLADVVAAIP